MASPLAWFSSLFSRPSEAARLDSLLRDPARSPTPTAKMASLFKPFRKPGASDVQNDSLAALTDLLVSMRESIDRQNQRHEELLTYLSHLPKAMEMIPENSRLQAEALGALRQHLENQGTLARKMEGVLEKVGQASVDQRRILDTVRQRLDMLSETDQKVAEHFGNFASALTTSSDTTRIAGEVLNRLETNIRQRDEALTRIIEVHQRRHTVLLAAAVVLASAALIAATVGVFVIGQGR